MKVQIFPKPTLKNLFLLSTQVGALTLKPSAYQARPWELTRVEIFNHYEGTGTLTLHLRGPRVIRVSQAGWMRDRIRFLYDGLKRQRLTRPYVRGLPVGWSTGLAVWFSLVGSRSYSFRVDPEVIHFWWLLRGVNFFGDSRNLTLGVFSVDQNYYSEIYHGGFGLKPVEQAGVSLPGWISLEEQEILAGPTGGVSYFLFSGVVAQLFNLPSPMAFTWGGFTTPGENHPRGPQRALFQVSPLQNLLSPGW